MKKIAAVILSLIFMFSMSACSSQDMESQNVVSISMTNAESSTENTEQSENDILHESTDSFENNHILIAYFTRWGNTNYPDDIDASVSASIVDNENIRYGTTEYIANMIAEEVNGDLYRIETIKPYTDNFEKLRNVNHNEMEQNFLPELKENDIDIAKYDTVFIGYPVWATDVPQAVISFMTKYDLSGKTVIPFCTHDGYGAGGSYQTIAEKSHAAVSLDGIAIESSYVSDAKNTVGDWLTAIGISDFDERNETAIQILVGDTILNGILYDTALAEEIKEYFPLTISMVGYGGREYYGGVDFYPENLEDGQRTFENGDITYCESHHNMAIFYNQTDNPDLSVDVIPIGHITSDLSVFDGLGSRADITFSLVE